jgi:hypothetical protein
VVKGKQNIFFLSINKSMGTGKQNLLFCFEQKKQKTPYWGESDQPRMRALDPSGIATICVGLSGAGP